MIKCAVCFRFVWKKNLWLKVENTLSVQSTSSTSGEVKLTGRCVYISLVSYSSLWTLLMSSTLPGSWHVAFRPLAWCFRLGRCSENQLETLMARRRKPSLMQCISEVMGMSEKKAWFWTKWAPLRSKSLTTLRISWRSACRIIPRTLRRVETCFFLWGGRTREGSD